MSGDDKIEKERFKNIDVDKVSGGNLYELVSVGQLYIQERDSKYELISAEVPALKIKSQTFGIFDSQDEAEKFKNKLKFDALKRHMDSLKIPGGIVTFKHN